MSAFRPYANIGEAAIYVGLTSSVGPLNTSAPDRLVTDEILE